MDLSGALLEKLQEGSEFIIYRARRNHGATPVLAKTPTSRPGGHLSLARLEHELHLARDLDSQWALGPLELCRYEGRPVLALEDPGGQPLDRMITKPLEAANFLQLAIGITVALRQAHARGLIHKDIKPANVWVDGTGVVRLTGFGAATRLPRERQTGTNPEEIDGSLAYMAPEQTGRMNRSIDNRSDLYALGITFYEMLVGALPFPTADPLELIHCHIARPPPPPSVRVDGIPPVVEAIILKLLAKNADDRYQTAAGLEHDLRRCQNDVRAGRHDRGFPLAERDASDRLRIPEKLYGREAEVGFLLEAFEQVATHGQFDLVLISGYSGVGKSSVVDELQRALYSTRALYASGKFDQYKRNVPYATIAEAFQGLVKHILSLDDAQLEHWRAALMAAVGASGQLMVDLIPNLALVLGAQPPLPAIPPQEAKNRFNVVFRRFVAAFAQPDHPLVLFLDDLQWLDAATLELLQQLATDEEIPCLLVIGAYRSNEVGPSHRLSQTLDVIKDARGELKEIRLDPLKRVDVSLLVADTLRAELLAIAPLADLVCDKTYGNPFFAYQFLASFAFEGLLVFDGDRGVWTWDLDRIGAAGITDNVAELMATRLVRYDPSGLGVLKELACLGFGAETATLASLLGLSEAAIHAALRGFVADGLLHRIEDRYAFAHDGVRDAAYALIPGEQQVDIHLKIGRWLADDAATQTSKDGIFGIVNQLNRGSARIVTAEERQRLAGLNLLAGKRAIAASAYESALTYLDAGCVLLTADRWDRHYRLSFDLEFYRADCEFMMGRVASAEEKFAMLAERSADLTDLALIVARQMWVYTYQGRTDVAIELALACAARMGEVLPATVPPERLQQEYEAFERRFAKHGVEEIFEMPAMTDRHWLQVMDVLEALLCASGVGNSDLQSLAILRMINISLDHGLTDESAHACANFAGFILGWRFGHFETGFRFGALALRLADQRGLDRYASRIYAVISGTVGPWSLPLGTCFDLATRSLEMGREQGGVIYSGYAWSTAFTAALDGGKALTEVHRVTERGLAEARKLNFPLVIEFLTISLMVVRALRGLTAEIGSLSNADFDEESYERYLKETPHLWHALVRMRIRKLQLQYYAGNYDSCLRLIAILDDEIDPLKVFERAEYCFFSAVSRAAALTYARDQGGETQFQALQANHAQLSEWARRCPETFAGRASLVEAEIARLEGRELEAQRLYERAIRLMGDGGFVQHEALANELAGRFYAGQGFETIAHAYLQNARAAYARWGADGKVHQLDRAYPELIDDRSAFARFGTTPIQQIDLGAIVEISQAVSGEIVLDRLIERLMITVIEQAGAVRGLMLLPRSGSMRIVAEAKTKDSEVTVALHSDMKLPGQLPQSVLHYATRTREVVITGDALEPNQFSADAYLVVHKPRSILCLPLVKQGNLVAVLYLENNLSSHMFTPARLAVLQLLGSQAAISIENAELFRSIQEAQAEARRVGDELKRSFDMIPALAWRAKADGTFDFANKQWHDYTGIPADHPDFSNTWHGTFHPDDLEKVADRWRHLRDYGVSGEVEGRIRRFDGEYRRFLVRGTPLRDHHGTIVQWHGTNIDIEDLRRAEEAQEALARVSRVTALGELTVSIAHEVNQPLMAIVTNAATCLRWLSEDRFDIAEARLAAERIVRLGHRAADVIASIRALAKKASPEFVPLDLNDAILEVLQLTRNELDRNSINVETRLATGIGSARADRVQMQQVILNLIMNAIEAIEAADTAERTLKITSERVECNLIVVSVSDSGVGLDPAVSDRVFEALFTTKPGGVGMGLSICRSIIEAHGGRLSVGPNAPRGATFKFSVPVHVEERALVRQP